MLSPLWYSSQYIGQSAEAKACKRCRNEEDRAREGAPILLKEDKLRTTNCNVHETCECTVGLTVMTTLGGGDQIFLSILV